MTSPLDDIVLDVIKHRIIRDMERDELKNRVMRYYDRHSQVEINSTPEEHKEAERIMQRNIDEKTGTSQSEYSFKLKPHPNQRILVGDKII